MAKDDKLVAVEVIPGSTFTLGAERTLFQAPDFAYTYDVAADGQRFLMFTPLEKVKASPLTVILNWAKGLNP